MAKFSKLLRTSMKLPLDVRTVLSVFLAALVFVWPIFSPSTALALGLTVGCLRLNPFLPRSRAWPPKLLSKAVIGLGFGINLKLALAAGTFGLIYTALGIALTLFLGLGLGRLLKQSVRSSLLLAVGTAICGGSAIAAVAPVINAKQEEISLALSVVFLLNAVALFIFPFIGHWLEFNQSQFGLWAALAIHDTSSVVGATFAYGDEALRIGTTVKLARALWIVPVTLIIGILWSKLWEKEYDDEVTPKKRFPWFILGFLVAAAISTWVPGVATVCHALDLLAKRFMVFILFLIGANLDRNMLKSMSLYSLVHGITLWLLVSSATLTGVAYSIIRLRW
jgi:uncharacterized integral membrane protein (TIGR00698 family)